MTAASIHESAWVDDGAHVGPGTRVWHGVHIRAGARVGAGCTLGKSVYVDADVEIGDRCKIQNHVSIYTGVTLGDEVFVGPSATFTNDIAPRAFTQDWTVVPTHVESGASIGANATVVCGVRIGRYAMVAAGAVVTDDVLAHELVAGVPARRIGWVCRCGARLDALPPSGEALSCSACDRGVS